MNKGFLQIYFKRTITNQDLRVLRTRILSLRNTRSKNQRTPCGVLSMISVIFFSFASPPILSARTTSGLESLLPFGATKPSLFDVLQHHFAKAKAQTCPLQTCGLRGFVAPRSRCDKKIGHPFGCPIFLWSGLRGSNPPPSPWQGDALPNELNPHFLGNFVRLPFWCLRSESNQRHGDFQSPALPTELQRHLPLF